MGILSAIIGGAIMLAICIASSRDSKSTESDSSYSASSYLEDKEKQEREEKEREKREEREFINELDDFFNRVNSDIIYWQFHYDSEDNDFSDIGLILPPQRVLEDIGYNRCSWLFKTTYDILKSMEFSYVVPEGYRIRAGSYMREYDKLRYT